MDYLIEKIFKKGKELIANDNFQRERINVTCDRTLKYIDDLAASSNLRKQRLRENWSRLQFYWRCEVIETWIQQKEEILRANMTSIPSNLTYIKQLIARHDTFMSSLNAFESEGIRPFVDLRYENSILYACFESI